MFSIKHFKAPFGRGLEAHPTAFSVERLKKVLLCGMVLFFLSAEWIQSQENPSRYLDSLERKYSGLKDYTADVRVHFDVEALKAPDMQGKLYYKSPDKMKVETKGIFFFPKEAGYFNPSKFKPEDYEIKLLEHLTSDHRNVVRLQLIPKEMRRYSQRFILAVDVDRSLVLEIQTLTAEGREVKAAINYGKFGDFDLPTHIELQFELPPTDASETKEVLPFGQRTKRITGKVEITYSKYKVNLGLSDEIFKETESHPSR